MSDAQKSPNVHEYNDSGSVALHFRDLLVTLIFILLSIDLRQ